MEKFYLIKKKEKEIKTKKKIRKKEIAISSEKNKSKKFWLFN